MQVPLRSGQGFLSFCGFSVFWVFFLWLPAGFPTFPAYFRGCGAVAVFLSTEISLYTCKPERHTPTAVRPGSVGGPGVDLSLVSFGQDGPIRPPRRAAAAGGAA